MPNVSSVSSVEEGVSPSPIPSASSHDEGAGDSRLIVTVNPPDIVTGVGETIPSLDIFAPADASQSLLDALAPRISLVTWPEQTLVDTEQVAMLAVDERSPSSIELRPKTPLADRWYAVRVAGLPASLALPRFVQSKKLADGVSVWRFRTGSGPVVSSMELCEKEGRQTGSVTFSERIDPGRLPSASIAFDRGDCHYLPPPIVGTPDKAADQTTKIVHFTCDTVGDVTVTWRSGATAASGSANAVPSATYRLRRSAMEDVGDSCWRLMADI